MFGGLNEKADVGAPGSRPPRGECSVAVTGAPSRSGPQQPDRVPERKTRTGLAAYRSKQTSA